MDVAFPYKEAITNAYDLIIVTRSNIAWKLYGLEEKAKG